MNLYILETCAEDSWVKNTSIIMAYYPTGMWVERVLWMSYFMFFSHPCACPLDQSPTRVLHLEERSKILTERHLGCAYLLRYPDTTRPLLLSQFLK